MYHRLLPHEQMLVYHCAQNQDLLIQDSQDNHSAWILHVKGVTKEHADLALSNEELTARCNVVVSLPEFANEEGDVVLINEENITLFQKIKSIFR